MGTHQKWWHDQQLINKGVGNVLVWFAIPNAAQQRGEQRRGTVQGCIRGHCVEEALATTPRSIALAWLLRVPSSLLLSKDNDNNSNLLPDNNNDGGHRPPAVITLAIARLAQGCVQGCRVKEALATSWHGSCASRCHCRCPRMMMTTTTSSPMTTTIGVTIPLPSSPLPLRGWHPQGR